MAAEHSSKSRRHLPVIPASSAPATCQTEPPPERSAWHWGVLSTAAIMLVWAPLAVLALWTVQVWLAASAGSLEPAQVRAWFASLTWTQSVIARFMTMGLPVSAFLLACGSVGAVVGRWSEAPARAIGYSGTAAAFLSWLVGALRTGFAYALPTLLMASLFGFASAWTGHLLGRRLRHKRHPQPSSTTPPD